MNSLNDSITLGLIFTLVIAVISIYFYIKLQEFENKIMITEALLFDMKSALELISYESSLPVHSNVSHQSHQSSGVTHSLTPVDFTDVSPSLIPFTDDSEDKTGDREGKSLREGEEEAEEKILGEGERKILGEAENKVLGEGERTELGEKKVLGEALGEALGEEDSKSILSFKSMRYTELLGMKTSDLRKLAKSKNIQDYQKLSKKDLVEHLSALNEISEVE